MKYLVIETATKKVTPFDNIEKMFAAYPQLNVTQDAYVASSAALSTSQDIEAIINAALFSSPFVVATTQDYKDKLTSHATSNDEGDTTIVCTASIPTDTPSKGLLKISDGTTTYNLRYKSYDTATFTLDTKAVTATTGGSGTVLKIASGTFLDGVVKPGDTVVNVTDSSWATVVSIDSATQITTTQLAGNTDETTPNAYTADDSIVIGGLPTDIDNTFYVYTPCIDHVYRGFYCAQTDVRTSKIYLSDALPKDTPQGSYLMVYDASAGTFKRYRYYSAIDKEIVLSTSEGICDAGGNGTKLIDAAATFSTDGVQVGDIVYNSTDGSYAAVVTVDSETQLTTATLAGGTANTWAAGNSYIVQVNNVALTESDYVLLPNWKLTPTGLEIIKLN